MVNAFNYLLPNQLIQVNIKIGQNINWFEGASHCCKYGMRYANLSPERIDCFHAANFGYLCKYYLKYQLTNFCNYYCQTALKTPIKVISGGTYIGASNKEANDFPVFCSDKYHVDPSYWYSVPGLCKECSLALYVSPTYPAYPYSYLPAPYTHVGYNVLCEDL